MSVFNQSRSSILTSCHLQNDKWVDLPCFSTMFKTFALIFDVKYHVNSIVSSTMEYIYDLVLLPSLYHGISTCAISISYIVQHTVKHNNPQ